MEISHIFQKNGNTQVSELTGVEHDENSQNLLPPPNYEARAPDSPKKPESLTDNRSSGDNSSNQQEEVSMTSGSKPGAYVSPSSSSCKKKRRKDLIHPSWNHNDEEVEELMLHKFPFSGVQDIFNSDYKRTKYDPRGYFPNNGQPLPSAFCIHCCCLQKKCHDSRFGLYCGLRVAESIKLLGLKKMHSDKLRELVKQAYNEILRVTVVQEVGILDTHNQYEIPLCLENRTMKNVVRHFAYQKFSAAMENRLKNGSVESEGNGTFSFFKALNIEDEI